MTMNCWTSFLFSRILLGRKSKMSAWFWTSPCECLVRIFLTPEIPQIPL
jgi:hypothetical protein